MASARLGQAEDRPQDSTATPAWAQRDWMSNSCTGPNTPPVFETALNRLLEGHTIGSAFEPFNQQYALRSLLFSEKLHALFQANIPRDQWNENQLNRLENSDDRCSEHIVLGDPAVRLPIDAGAEIQTRPTIERVPRRAAEG